jgi:hypothetical protein
VEGAGAVAPAVIRRRSTVNRCSAPRTRLVLVLEFLRVICPLFRGQITRHFRGRGRDELLHRGYRGQHWKLKTADPRGQALRANCRLLPSID